MTSYEWGQPAHNTGSWRDTLKPGAEFNSCFCLENVWKIHIRELRVDPGWGLSSCPKWKSSLPSSYFFPVWMSAIRSSASPGLSTWTSTLQTQSLPRKRNNIIGQFSLTGAHLRSCFFSCLFQFCASDCQSVLTSVTTFDSLLSTLFEISRN